MSDDKKWPSEAIYMIRTVQQHHVHLSTMADQKANMLIGATFVVFTIAIGQSQRSNFSLPLFILAIAAFLSATLAALAVMPKTSAKPGAKPNWLFFGAFTHIDEDEFTARILASAESQETIYKTMLHDIYQIGTILQTKKYRYLAWAYRVFLTGLVATVMAFIFEYSLGPIL